jgi:hypothetical protein
MHSRLRSLRQGQVHVGPITWEVLPHSSPWPKIRPSSSSVRHPAVPLSSSAGRRSSPLLSPMAGDAQALSSRSSLPCINGGYHRWVPWPPLSSLAAPLLPLPSPYCVLARTRVALSLLAPSSSLLLHLPCCALLCRWWLPRASPCIHVWVSCRLARSLLLQLTGALPFPQPRRSLLSPTSPALLPLPAAASLWCFLPARVKFPCSLALGPCSTAPCCFSARVKFSRRVRPGRKPVCPRRACCSPLLRVSSSSVVCAKFSAHHGVLSSLAEFSPKLSRSVSSPRSWSCRGARGRTQARTRRWSDDVW